MPGRQHGFTLIEALLSVVVLGVGLLGLGQLQARLWSASGDLHSTDDAWLLAGNTLEQFSIAQMIDAGLVPATGIQPGSSAFTVALELTRRAQLTEARVRIEWQHRNESRSLQLDGAIYTASQASDSRLLLTAN